MEGFKKYFNHFLCVVAGARFGPGRSFCCANTRSTLEVVSTWCSSTSPTLSVATLRSASKHAVSSANCIRRGRFEVLPRLTTRPPASPLSRTLMRWPLRSSRRSTAHATSTALLVSRCNCFVSNSNQSINQNYFIVHPKVDQRAGQLSLSHVFI